MMVTGAAAMQGHKQSAGGNLGLNEDGGALLHEQGVVEEKMVHRQSHAAGEGELLSREACCDVHPSENRSKGDTVELVAISRREHLAHAHARDACRRRSDTVQRCHLRAIALVLMIIRARARCFCPDEARTAAAAHNHRRGGRVMEFVAVQPRQAFPGFPFQTDLPYRFQMIGTELTCLQRPRGDSLPTRAAAACLLAAAAAAAAHEVSQAFISKVRVCAEEVPPRPSR